MSFTEYLLDIVSTTLGAIPLRVFGHDTQEFVNYPFIDEIFHLRQTQAYCDGDWGYWDPKITTPPGLYYLGAAYNILTDGSCDLSSLRSLNFIGGLVLALIAFYLRIKVDNAGFTSLSIFMNPLVAIYYSLFYTDVWSAVFAVASYAIAATTPFKSDYLTASISAALGLISVTFRQTNIVWTAFAMIALLDAISKRDEHPYTKTVSDQIKSIVSVSLKNWLLLIPYLADAILFANFILYNGSITLGDKGNHQVTFHLMQLLYCSTFIAIFTVPLWFSLDLFKNYFKDNLLSTRGLLFNAVWIPVLAVVVQNFTIIHPFLLADNRHYTFYLVRRFIIRDEMSKYELLPVYHFACYVIWDFIKQSAEDSESSSNSSLAMFFALICSTALTIIPSPLFEPRYFILPFIFFRLLIKPSSKPIVNISWLRENNWATRLVLEAVWEWLWTQAIYIIFLTYSFMWETEEYPQRIIW
ncbi:DEKNAAC100820 [Brettanomyces naardenensis]|uniref:Dol-P-Glc:Glc(2)Man(9)GlcNAc(2)-PP-Dol alpha-1,2-glucosyltransferase n=1 Tax=Brettanomyces naardenensis TaxID=13370 RepID=A0A448YEG2_BRENA|nr:DEKNAAC100820 [Brettanomyces naardenensis]